MAASTSFKLSATIQTVIVFLIVSLPITYRITNGILGGIVGKLADSYGNPTLLGIFIHSIVFGLIIYGLMSF